MVNFVDIETPYTGDNKEERGRNLLYARACVRDSLMRGERPFASHLFYTQPGILDDNISQERNMGIKAGKDLIESLLDVITVVYHDLGISEGMWYGIDLAKQSGRKVEYRVLGEDWEARALSVTRKHSHASVWGFDE